MHCMSGNLRFMLYVSQVFMLVCLKIAAIHLPDNAAYQILVVAAQQCSVVQSRVVTLSSQCIKPLRSR